MNAISWDARIYVCPEAADSSVYASLDTNSLLPIIIRTVSVSVLALVMMLRNSLLRFLALSLLCNCVLCAILSE